MAIRRAHGFALIDLIFVCGIIGLLCSIAMPRFLLAKQSAGAASAIGSLRAIDSGELTYALTCGSGFYAPNLSTLSTPPPGSSDAFVSGGLSGANTMTKGGYLIQLSGTPFAAAPPTCNGLTAGQAAQGFKSGADPADPSNVRFFSSNVSAIIYEDNSTMFATVPEIGDPTSGHPLR